MCSNRRRSHIHFIIQYDMKTNEYTGTRVVVFIKAGEKLIYDTNGFVIHRYINSKTKNYEVSRWKVISSQIQGVIKKEMINYSIDEKYRMIHIIYESAIRDISEYMEECFIEQGIDIPIELIKK